MDLRCLYTDGNLLPCAVPMSHIMHATDRARTLPCRLPVGRTAADHRLVRELCARARGRGICDLPPRRRPPQAAHQILLQRRARGLLQLRRRLLPSALVPALRAVPGATHALLFARSQDIPCLFVGCVGVRWVSWKRTTSASLWTMPALVRNVVAVLQYLRSR